MADYIDREHLLTSFCAHCIESGTDGKQCKVNCTDVEIIKNQPVADVRENVLGYWDIHRGNWADEFECSVCHKISKTGGNYCFNCGADMREVQDAK